jgi:tetratricopeptide (TPR) repeat protein
MSLLIKALDKAQEAKAKETQAQAAKIEQTENAKVEQPQADKTLETSFSSAIKRKPHALENDIPSAVVNAASAKLAAANALEMELSPISKKVKGFEAESDIVSTASTLELQDSVSTVQASTTSKAAAKSAANVFSAKRIESNNQNTILALIAVAGLCVLLAIAAYFYLFADRTPDFAIEKHPLLSSEPFTEKPVPATEQLVESTETLSDKPVTASRVERQSTPLVSEANEKTAQAENSVKKSPAFRDESLAGNELVLNEMLVEKTPHNRLNQPKQNVSKAVEVEAIASKSASIQVSKTQPQVGVNPVLMDAFNAYNAGDDAVASKLYRQVLQRDLHNVDALLGLGAIAQRQGRIADANGWYAKVLEVEPRNALATASILNSQPQNDAASNESRIKSMLAKQPDDANLHAALGSFYADLNQWSAAQQAYFDAYSLNANADNAFNLAVSLDHMGKPKLALPYYQQALQLAQSGGSNIDKNALEARIAAIQ